MSANTRPGGRTARTRAAVFEAVATLVAERGHAAVRMADVAERAGVATTSLYRRWGDVRSLVMEVAVEELLRDPRLPDTGTLAGDLGHWARNIVAGLKRPGGSAFFSAFLGAAGPDSSGRRSALLRRLDQIAAMLERARARGEPTPPVVDVLDYLLAPLYARALMDAPLSEDHADRLVSRLLKR
jgi:AcrR family transcriptional regulator